MPDRWVGGKGSAASPMKGWIIEGKVLDERGRDQGTFLVEVVRLYGPTATGRSFLGNFVTATDSYYRHWVTTKDGKATVTDGTYHLCQGDPRTCQGGAGGHAVVVHLGKWRRWGIDELLKGDAEHLDREAGNLMTHNLKRSPSRPRGRGDLPWSSAKLDIGGKRKPVGLEREGLEEIPVTRKKKAPPPKGAGKEDRVTVLRRQLAELKKELETVEESQAGKRRREKSEPRRERTPEPKPKVPKRFDVAPGLRGKAPGGNRAGATRKTKMTPRKMKKVKRRPRRLTTRRRTKTGSARSERPGYGFQ